MLTVADVAQRQRVTSKTVLKWINLGLLTAIKAGPAPNSPFRVSEEAYEDFVERQTFQPAS